MEISNLVEHSRQVKAFSLVQKISPQAVFNAKDAK
jgi:hypothetical protein